MTFYVNCLSADDSYEVSVFIKSFKVAKIRKCYLLQISDKWSNAPSFMKNSWMWKRSSLIRVFPVCYSDKYFVNSSP